MNKWIEYILEKIGLVIGVSIAIGHSIYLDRRLQLIAFGIIVWLTLALNMLLSHF